MAENPPNAQLEAFLSGAPEPEPQQAPPATPESTPPAEPPKGPPEPPVVEPDDEADPPEPSPGEPVVPRRALEDERHKRQNYVAQAAKFEAERDMLAKQLEELKKAPAQQAQPPAQPQYQPIDPAQDPAGYHARIQGVLLNERLNMSEMMLRKELGAEKVDAAIAEFKQHAAADPRLYTQLYQQTDPYGWMAGEVERLRLIRRVTTDPGRLRGRATRQVGGGGQWHRPCAACIAGRQAAAQPRQRAQRTAAQLQRLHRAAEPGRHPGPARHHEALANTDRGACRRHRLVSPRSTLPPSGTVRVQNGRECCRRASGVLRQSRGVTLSKRSHARGRPQYYRCKTWVNPNYMG